MYRGLPHARFPVYRRFVSSFYRFQKVDQYG